MQNKTASGGLSVRGVIFDICKYVVYRWFHESFAGKSRDRMVCEQKNTTETSIKND